MLFVVDNWMKKSSGVDSWMKKSSVVDSWMKKSFVVDNWTKKSLVQTEELIVMPVVAMKSM
jgi:hypothetical protein